MFGVRVTDLVETAAGLPVAWSSQLLGEVGAAGVKVLRMDGRPVPSEVHTTTEALLVLDGQLELALEGRELSVRAGELCLVPGGHRHAVRAGSSGTLVIVEVADRPAAGAGDQNR